MTYDRQQLALSRRRFLSGSLTLAGALAAGPLSRPAAVFAASGPGVVGAG
nr:hypothetical protein [Euzebyales bacterium]